MLANDLDFGTYGGATAGQAVEDRWQYPGIGYNATNGTFYIGEEKAEELTIVPFAIRQCKEVTDALGNTQRYPIRTPRAQMIEGDATQRLQVVGLVNGELHTFGARSWTARAAWLNPRSGQWHAEQFPVGIWFQLADYIKEVKASKGVATAPLCWELKLVIGLPVELSSAANAKQKSKGTPIILESVKFVGAEQAQSNEALFVEEALDEWVSEWNRITRTAAPDDGMAAFDQKAPAPIDLGEEDGLAF